jgi:hypothetical protein
MNKRLTKQLNTNEARKLLALKALFEMIVETRSRADVVARRERGGIELEDFADALEKGLPHPLLEHWQEQKAANNRPGPGLNNKALRRYVVLMCETLQRTGLGKLKARRIASQALEKIGAAVSADAIERWQRDIAENAPLGGADEKVIASAASRSTEDIVRYFIGLCHFRSDPVLVLKTDP